MLLLFKKGLGKVNLKNENAVEENVLVVGVYHKSLKHFEEFFWAGV